MKTKILFLLLFLISAESNAQVIERVLINEVNLGEKRSYVELLVVGDLNQNNELVDLSGWIIDNNSFSVPNDENNLVLGNCFTNLKQGTIILIYDDHQPHGAIDINNDGTPNNEGIYQIPLSSSCLKKCDSDNFLNCPTNNNSLKWRDIIKSNIKGDAIALMDNTEELVHAINWSGEEFEYNNNANTTNIDPPTGRPNLKLGLTGGGNDGKDICSFGTYEMPVISTPGAVNGFLNGNMINVITAGDHDAPVSLNCTVTDDRVDITINNGTEPFSVQLYENDRRVGIPIKISERIIDFVGLSSNQYSVKVTDTDGCESICDFEIEDINTEEVCVGTCQKIGVEDEGYCYVWSPEPEGYDLPHPSTIEVCPRENIEYTLTVSEAGQEIEKLKYNLEVTELEVTLSPDDIEVLLCDGKPFILQVASPRSMNDHLFNWSTGDVTNKIFINPNDPNFTEGEYTVVVTRKSDNCTGSASIIVSLE